MTPILDDFVNRSKEINEFRNLIQHPRRRILFFSGPSGIGKSTLVRWLIYKICDTSFEQIFIDLNSNEKLADDSDYLCWYICHKLDADLSNRLDTEMRRIHQQWSRAEGDMSLLDSATAGHVSIAGSVSVGGDIVAGNKVTITNSSIIVNPDAGQLHSANIVNELVTEAFRTLFLEHLKKRKVLLIFDHYEDAGQTVQTWVQRNLLNVLLDMPSEHQNLWILVSGRTLPPQDNANHWQRLLHTVQVEPLLSDAIHTYWIEKRGLAPDDLNAAARFSAGVPLLLFMMANNAENEQYTA